MTKKDFLTKLNKHLNGLDKATREDLMEYYEGIIDEKLSSGQSLEKILFELGEPRHLAEKIISNMKGCDSQEELVKIVEEPQRIRIESEEPKKAVNTGVTHSRIKIKKERKGLGFFWSLYLIFAIVTVPLTIVFFAVFLALGIIAIVLGLLTFIVAIAGIAGAVYGIVIAIMSKSVMVGCVYFGFGLLITVIGISLSYLVIKMIGRMFSKRRAKGGVA